MPRNTQKLSKLLENIQDTAFLTHESIEREGIVPIIDFERSYAESRQFESWTHADIFWNLLIFTQPRTEIQQQFQNVLATRLASPETAFIVHQIMCRPPRVWSYRLSYRRGFAHTVAGPQKHNEISIDCCISATGAPVTDEHLYAIGWTLSFEDKIYLICAAAISQDEVFEIENVRPFPLQFEDDDFWEENLGQILGILAPARQPSISFPTAAVRRTNNSPEYRFEKVHALVRSALSPVFDGGTIQAFVATATPEQILQKVDEIVHRQSFNSERVSAETLRRRLIQAIGCDETGAMPCAHRSMIINDPTALLLLPPEHPVFETVHARDPIRNALAVESCRDDIERAFSVYLRERRWLNAFPCFDFTIENHAAVWGIPVDALHDIFAPELFSAHLPISPKGDVLKQLQNKFGMYLPDQPVPGFQEVLDVLTSRAFARTGCMSQIAQWIVACCSRYRYCLSEIEPDISSAQRSINADNQRLLKKGLQSLADMFKK